MVHFDISSLYFPPLFTSAPVQASFIESKKKKKIIGQVSTSSTGLVGLTPSSLSNSSRSIRVRYIALNGDGKYD